MASSQSNPSKIRFISLFSGAMGFDLGLERAGFKVATCVENDKAMVSTIRQNKPTLPIVDRSITDIGGAELRSLGAFANRTIPLVAGGPPCQAFSVFGTRGGISDTRGRLIFEFIRLVDELRPQVFVMENVRGLLSMPLFPEKQAATRQSERRELTRKGSLVQVIFQEFVKIGYRTDCFVVNAVNYGAPQLRERLIFIGNRYNLLADFPKPRYSNRSDDNLLPFRTLADAIGNGFKDPCPELMDFSPRKLKYLSMVPPGGNWRSLPVPIQKESMGKTWHLKGGRSAYWRKLSFNFPSPTVVTMPNHAGTSMCHPEELRAITVGEAAAIQEFPKKWKFCGTTTEKFRQVGNAVPICLGRVTGTAVKQLLRRIANREKEDHVPPSYRVLHLRPHVRTRSFWRNGESLAGDHSYYRAKDDASQQSSLQFED